VKKKPTLIQGGKWYGRITENGPLVPAPPDLRAPDAWVCRRLADYPNGQAPAGGALGSCSECRAVIVFNPQRRVSAPKVCMQCADIVPLPIES